MGCDPCHVPSCQVLLKFFQVSVQQSIDWSLPLCQSLHQVMHQCPQLLQPLPIALPHASPEIRREVLLPGGLWKLLADVEAKSHQRKELLVRLWGCTKCWITFSHSLGMHHGWPIHIQLKVFKTLLKFKTIRRGNRTELIFFGIQMYPINGCVLIKLILK